MIALLTGMPVFYGNQLVMVCGGVGYGVAVNDRVFQVLHAHTSNALVTVFIHTHVREDALDLFGFLTIEEKHVFEMLLSVSGVGPKTALTISSAGTNEIVKAVGEGNVRFFSTFSRVGKKLAQKIIIELKPKLGSLEDLELSEPVGKAKDVRQALESLGYADHDIRNALQKVDTENLALQDSIKASIRLLSNK